ncbi:MAG: hypothetical protein ACFB5Z_15485 [Elainellaceae cyanobacterium]
MIEARLLLDTIMGTPKLGKQINRLQNDLDHQKAKSLQVVPPMAKLNRDQVFISYSHQDAGWLQKLQKFLKPQARKGKLSMWDDTKINPGAK